MAKNDVSECRDCRYFEFDVKDGDFGYSCKKGKYRMIHSFVDACRAFKDKNNKESDCAETD